MIINVFCFGKMDNNGYSDLERYYEKKLSRFCKINIVSKKEQLIIDSIQKFKKNEEQIEKYLDLKGINILLDFNGREYSSECFAEFLDKNSFSINADINFFIGPSDGFSQEFRKKFEHKLSLGKITMPHQLARIVLLEQVYRSFKIIKNETYHK